MINNQNYIELENLVELIVDNRGKTVPTVSKGIPLIATNCIKHSSIYPTFENIRYINDDTYNNWFRAHLEPNDILFVNKGTPGRSCIVPTPINFVAAQDMVGLRFKKEYHPYYMLAVLRSNEIQQTIKNNYVGLVIPHYRKQELVKLKLPILDKSKRDGIGHLYYILSKKIELNNQINTELEAMAKTLYDYWFVQFDFPDENGKPYQSSGGKMVFNETLKREIPVGWEVTVFNDWISKTKTGDWGKEVVEGNYTEHVYCVRGTDINGLNGKGEVKAPERFILKNNLVKSLKPNDFVVEISGGSPTQSTGRIALLTEASLKRFDSNVICSNFCKALSLKDDEYVFNFLQEWQRLYDAGVFFGYEGKTSGIKNFLFDSFMTSYDIVKPPKNLVEKFYKKVETLENKKQINLQQNQELAQLRDWLLPMLMNGQVRVGECDEEDLGLVAEEKGEYKKSRL